MHAWKAASFLILLAVPGFVLADDEAPPVNGDGGEDEDDEPLNLDQLQQLHSLIDVDDNGKFSLDELFTFFRHTREGVIAGEGILALEEWDSDQDGKVSLNEIRQMDGPDVSEQHKALEASRFKGADVNGDGLLDGVELGSFINPEGIDNVLQVSAQETMKERDVDNDGFLSFDELWSKDQVSSPRSEVPEDAAMRMFKKLDEDGSGKIDVKELLRWESGHVNDHDVMERFMQLADTNGDQHVTVEELQAAHGKGENHAKKHFEQMAEHNEL